MIELKINNTAIPLPVDIKINREVETKIFTKSDEAYDFTFPVDLPLTREARLALGFPDVLSNAVVNREYSGVLSIVSADLQYATGVKVIVLSVSVPNQTCRVSLFGQYSSLKAAFGTKKVNDLTMGGPEIIEDISAGFGDIDYDFSDVFIKDGAYNYGPLKVNYSSGPVNSFMRKVAKGTIVRDYLFPKAVDQDPDLPGSNEGNAIINAWDHVRDRYVDADLYNLMAHEWKYMPDINPPNPFANPDRHFWVPMYKLIRVLQYCFSECGLTLIGNVLSDPKLQNMVLYNTHAINIGFSGGWVAPLTPGKHYKIFAGYPKAYIFPRNHLPDMDINEFVNEIGKRFNWQFEYDVINKTVTIKDDRKLLDEPTIFMDLTNRANPKPIINFERADSFLNGYQIAFEQDSADAATSENVLDEITGYRFRGAISKIGDSISITTPVDKDYLYVRNVNSYFEYKDGSGWVMMSHGIMPFKSTNKENLQQITTKVVSGPMDIFPVKMIDFITGYGRIFTIIGVYYENIREPVPYSSIGMTFDQYNYINWEEEFGTPYSPGVGHPWDSHRFQSNKPPKSHLPHLVNCIGFKDGVDSSEKYFMATCSSYDGKGNYVNAYSCSPGNPEGYSIYKDWWETLSKSVENSFVADFEVLIDAATYTKLKVNGSLLTIDNLRYLIKKANFIMPFPSIATMSLARV